MRGGAGLRGSGGRFGLEGRGRWRGTAAFDDVNVAAGCGAREQHALQRRGTQQAAVQMGEDGGEIGGAEARRDGVEVGGGGAVADGVDEVATVAEQGAGGVEEEPDVVGKGEADGAGEAGSMGSPPNVKL